MSKDESITDADIYSAASEPARDDQGRFSSQERPEPTETRPATDETPTPNLGQLPSEAGDQREPEQGQDEGNPQPQEAPQHDPRTRGMMADLQGERKRRQQYESDLANRDRELAEMRGRMQAMEQMFRGQQQPDPRHQQPQPAQQAPDPYEDPQGFAAFQAQQVFERQFQPFTQQYQQREEQLQRTITGLQRSQAVAQFGSDAARAAEEAFNTAVARGQMDPHEHRRINGADNPYAAAVEWHRRQQTFERVGTDPDAFFTSEFERRMKEDPAFQQQAYGMLNGQARTAQAAGAQAPAAAGRPAPVFVPSVNGATGSSARGATEISEADILAAAPTKMGRRG